MKKTILIKLSGEALSGKYERGLDFDYIMHLCTRIKDIHDMGINIAIVCGGGNFMRGVSAKEMDRVAADYVGMLATIMNCLVLSDVFKKLGCDVYNQSALDISIMDGIDEDKIHRAFDNNEIVIFGGGIGKPYYSTDTAAAARACDCQASLIIKLTNVDGVYDKDPNKYDDAIMYDEVTFDEVIEKQLGVMDLSAMEICRDNNIEIIVTNINNEMALRDIVDDKKIGTWVHCK